MFHPSENGARGCEVGVEFGLRLNIFLWCPQAPVWEHGGYVGGMVDEMCIGSGEHA